MSWAGVIVLQAKSFQLKCVEQADPVQVNKRAAASLMCWIWPCKTLNRLCLLQSCHLSCFVAGLFVFSWVVQSDSSEKEDNLSDWTADPTELAACSSTSASLASPVDTAMSSASCEVT